MVGPIARDDRSSLVRRLKVGFVALIGLSTGLIAVHVDASLPEIATLTGIGVVFGVLVVWLVFPGDGSVTPSRRRQRR